MSSTYAVVWREATGPVYSGKLVLGLLAVELEGGAPRGRHVLYRVFYDELTDVYVSRAGAERLDGRPALVLGRRTGSPLRIASVNGVGTIPELAEELARRTGEKVAL